MISNDIKEIATCIIEAFNRCDIQTIDQMTAATFVQHSPGFPPTRDAFLQFMQGSFSAFPDGSFTIHDLLSENYKVLLRWSFTGTHTGQWPFRPGPPTLKRIAFDGMDLWRFDEAGMLAEAWFFADMLGFMRQLGRI